MRYISTRGATEPMGFSEAVATGLAPDGGLLLPESFPDLSGELDAWSRLTYPELCEAFFRYFATDLAPEVLRDRIRRSYATFDHSKVAPLVRLDPKTFVLELFHGPTLAFKDFALQLLGNLYEEQIRRTGKPINVLGATSGDTGSAAIHGLLGKEGVNIFILYPRNGVAPLQERQMACTGAPNVHPIAVDGTFDDCQAIVKDLFGDLELKQRYNLSAINSINLARVMAQCVYYYAAWFQLPAKARENVEFVVPTGNFGNILAGWMTQKMGLPVRRFCVATNQNDILYRLFETGRYEVDSVQPSHAPSMDIQVASNFERFIYFHEKGDTARVKEIMQTFKATGRYTFEAFERDTFRASKATDGDIERIIADVYRRYGYIVDPHTATGFVDLDPAMTSVVLGTAHPAKFPDTLQQAIGSEPTAPALEELKARQLHRNELPAQAETIRQFIEQTVRL
ncbi:MAG: threonine synthase [Verrucomicrobiota bacterium JB022]|nr:threonine synthase [Verrucomicrobiota bacterium JB022]